MSADLRKAFLDLIAWSEGTSTSSITLRNGYDVIVSGIHGPEVFTDFSQHPFENRPAKLIAGPSPRYPSGLYSTASGRYQILRKFWDDYQKTLKLPDFGPASQDAVALQQIKERGALALIDAGEVMQAVEKCSNIWASLPGNDYAQNAHPMPVLMARWNGLVAA
jgi:muramidase (phage lysozyme)